MESNQLIGPIYGRIARVSRPKLNAPGTHDGVQLLDGRVAHTSLDENTRICSFQEFAAGHPVRLEYMLPHTRHWQSLKVLNDELARNARYNLLDYNCEIFARKVVLQEPKSPQVGFWLAIGALLGVWFLSGHRLAA